MSSLYFGNVQKLKRLFRSSDMVDLDDQIQQLLQCSGAPRATVMYRRRPDSPHSKIFKSDSSIITETDVKDIDRIASITKLLINVAFVRLVHAEDEQYKRLNIKWEEKVSDLYNRFRERRGLPVLRKLQGHPILRDLLQHCNGIASMNDVLLGPDGAPLVTIDEFLEIAPRISKDRLDPSYPMRTSIEYSNGNHILAGLILEAICGKDLQEAMHDLVFEPFGMHETFMNECPDHLKSRLVDGYRVHADQNQALKVNRRDASDSVEACVFGAFSSHKDIARFFETIAQAYSDAQDGISKSVFNQAMMSDFFGSPGRKQLRDGPITRLGGQFCELSCSSNASDSYNEFIVPDGRELETYSLGKPKLEQEGWENLKRIFKRGKHCLAFHKSGLLDGHSAASWQLHTEGTYVVVLVNAVGPLDITDYIAHVVLQEILDLRPRVNILAKAQVNLALTQKTLQSIEEQDREEGTSSTSDIRGVYRHVDHGQMIDITTDNMIRIKGRVKTSGPFKLIRLSQEKLRIVPGRSPFGVDRWSAWRDTTLAIKYENGVRCLTRGSDCYVLESHGTADNLREHRA